MDIQQGDIFWFDFGVPAGSEPGYRRPVIVIQNDMFNMSKIDTVVIIATTTNYELAHAPGNVLLKKGEGSLPKDSVANISQIYTVDKSSLTEKIGTLSSTKIKQIIEGVKVLIDPVDKNLLSKIDTPGQKEQVQHSEQDIEHHGRHR